MSGIKHDQKKVRLELIDAEFTEELGRVLTLGAEKYSAENWRAGLHFKRVLGAIKRHTAAMERGEDRDPETGLLHAAHLACETMFLGYMQLHIDTYRQFDDRWRCPTFTVRDTTSTGLPK
jgi:hypothetical protein